jgi:hypothetical protein
MPNRSGRGPRTRPRDEGLESARGLELCERRDGHGEGGEAARRNAGDGRPRVVGRRDLTAVPPDPDARCWRFLDPAPARHLVPAAVARRETQGSNLRVGSGSNIASERAPATAREQRPGMPESPQKHSEEGVCSGADRRPDCDLARASVLDNT